VHARCQAHAATPAAAVPEAAAACSYEGKNATPSGTQLHHAYHTTHQRVLLQALLLLHQTGAVSKTLTTDTQPTGPPQKVQQQVHCTQPQILTTFLGVAGDKDVHNINTAGVLMRNTQ
jgi:hypothetical protein